VPVAEIVPKDTMSPIAWVLAGNRVPSGAFAAINWLMSILPGAAAVPLVNVEPADCVPKFAKFIAPFTLRTPVFVTV